MFDADINDSGYVWGRVIYDDAVMDEAPKKVYKNRVKAVAVKIDKLAREHIDEPIEEVMNFDR